MFTTSPTAVNVVVSSKPTRPTAPRPASRNGRFADASAAPRLDLAGAVTATDDGILVRLPDTDDTPPGAELFRFEPDEIDAIKLETKKTFELVQFVGTNEISPLYYDQPYYIVPSDDLAEDAYRVVRDALRKSQKTGIGQLTLHGLMHDIREGELTMLDRDRYVPV